MTSSEYNTGTECSDGELDSVYPTGRLYEGLSCLSSLNECWHPDSLVWDLCFES